MEFYTFTDYRVFTWIWAPVLAVLLLGLLAAVRSRRVIRLFYDADRPEPRVRFGRKYVKTALAAAAVLLFTFALAGPRWNPQPVQVTQAGRDIVVLLDVSKSMMCKDMKPNRLEQARIAIEDLVGQLQGDRIALVAFSGAPKLICPLTTDYGYFLTVLREVDVNTVQHGGTLIGDAVHYAAERVYPKTGKAYRDLILITDGEDHGSFPEKAAEIVKDKMNIRMHIFGLGDSVTGAKVPVYDSYGNFVEYRKYQDQFVYSKLDEKNQNMLMKMANVTGGSYLYVGTGGFDLGQIYTQKILTAKRREIGSTRSVEYREGFQVFLLAGLVLLLFERLLGERR